MFFFITFILYIFINIYLFTRLFSALEGYGALRSIVCAVLLIFALSFPASRLLDAWLPHKASVVLFITGSLYFAPMVYCFLLTLLSDLFRFINYHFAVIRMSSPYRRTSRFGFVILIIGASLAITAAGAINARMPAVISRDAEWKGGPDATERGIKIAFLSDIHIGIFNGAEHLARVLDTLRPLSPDIILLGGDIIDDIGWMENDVRAKDIRELLRSLKPRLGVWAVPGNHEYYAGLEACVSFLRESGVHVLMDDWASPGRELLLIGRDDFTVNRRGGKRASVSEIFETALGAMGGAAKDLPLVILDHQPIGLGEARDANAALQLSGHTHRGQLFPANLMVAMMYEKSYGLYRKDGTVFYISSGAGTWGAPVRTSGRPEAVIVNLKITP
ncbi:metallophosphatase [Synergistales bacterium]|nr:metallophosphatase [Synergistales bacterium]